MRSKRRERPPGWRVEGKTPGRTAMADTDARPLADPHTPDQPEHREGHDATDKPALQRDPSDCDAKLDIELDETFPSSDPPSTAIQD